MQIQQKEIQKKTYTSYSIEITENLENKIRFTCNKIHEVEWSGILFYTFEGTFEDNDLKIIAKDFIPMDIGSTTFTSFDMNAEVINYMTENNLLDCKIGLIHSHNNMATFFSGTDTKTLEQEGNNTNNFVSLIVNNEGTYSAAITRKINHNKNINDIYSYELFDTGSITKSKEYTETDTSIEWFELNVIKPHCSDYNDLNNRLNEIKTTKQKLQDKQKLSFKKEQPSIPKSYNNYYYNDFYDDCFFDDYYQTKSFGLKSEITLDEKQVDITLKQLLTGSILLSNTTTINLKKWANTMVSLYRQRFQRFEEFEDWVDTYTDFLLWNYMDKYITEESEPEIFLPILAKSLLSKILILKPNKYLEVFIKTIKKYTKK